MEKVDRVQVAGSTRHLDSTLGWTKDIADAPALEDGLAGGEEAPDVSPQSPPSFEQSEFETIIRRQRNTVNGLKIIDIPSRFPNVDNEWEFAVGYTSV